MITADVVEQLRDALATIDGLRTPEWGAASITAPAALVMLPDTIQYGTTYGADTDRFPDLQVVVLIAKPESWRSVRQLAPFLDGSGPQSVRQALEDYPYTACDAGCVKVKSVDFDTATYAGVLYLAAMFHLDIIGTRE